MNHDAKASGMENDFVRELLVAGLACVMSASALAQSPPAARKETVAPAAAGAINVNVLTGTWVRPDGGYLIVIRNVGRDGRLEAMYFNPNPVPFAKAQVTRDDATLRVSFELRAGGYEGSTYDLTYDPSNDRLSGDYYQAVAKQKFNIYFVRK